MKKTLLNSAAKLARAFRKDEDGATAMSFGLMLLVLAGAIGVGVDTAAAGKSRAKAQHLADTVALSAATHWREHEARPAADATDAFRHGVTYKASDIGIEFGDSVEDDVRFKVFYEENEERAYARVWGVQKTTLTKFLGRDSLPFEASARATFPSDEVTVPASVVAVLDNSGSMQWDDRPMVVDTQQRRLVKPGDAVPRIDALKTATEALMERLEGHITNNTGDTRLIRTGMLPYSGSIINNRTVPMDWGVVSDDAIDDMRPVNLTNSAPPIRRAQEWLQDEDRFHEAESGAKPRKYAIFMTDGANSGNQIWTPTTGTGLWRREECRRVFIWDQGCDFHYAVTPLGEVPTSTPRQSYEVVTRAGPFEEGHLRTQSDVSTLASCDEMKRQGVTVFAVGFAVQPGWYDRNPRNGWLPPQHITEAESARIHSFLQECSSGPGFFMSSANGDSLTAIFDDIGRIVVQQSVRLSQ